MIFDNLLIKQLPQKISIFSKTNLITFQSPFPAHRKDCRLQISYWSNFNRPMDDPAKANGNVAPITL